MEPQWEKYYSVLKAHIKAVIDDTIVDNIIPHIRLTKGIDIPLNGLLKENNVYENALFNLVNTCIDELKDTYYVVLENPIESSEDRNKENLDKIFNSKPIKSSTYQFVAEFDGKYQPRVIDYMFKNGSPSWTDLNEDWSNGKMFTEQELPKVAKQLERYYAETGGGASDIEIVKDNGESVYLEEFLQEGSFDKAWKRIEDDWLNNTMTK